MAQDRDSSGNTKNGADVKPAKQSLVSADGTPAGREQETKMPSNVTGAGETSVATSRTEFQGPDDGRLESGPDPTQKVNQRKNNQEIF